MKYPYLSEEDRQKMLLPPTGKIRVVIDSDTFNEVDDQFAVSYALMSREKLQVEAVYAAPFSSGFFDELVSSDEAAAPMTSDIEEGLEQSYQEILKIYDKLELSPEGKVFRGSKSYLKDKDTPIESDAARDLVKKAMESEEVLYVAALGEITNIASAILMEPEIIKKIVIVWLAGQPLHWPHALEFNLGQDVMASQIILDSGVPLVLVPCMAVASHLLTTGAELRECLQGRSKIGTFLADTVIKELTPEAANNMLSLFRLTYLRELDDYDKTIQGKSEFSAMASSRIIWDISVIGYLVNPLWCPSNLIEAPSLTDDIKWGNRANAHHIRICNYVYRDGIFGDMFEKLSKAPK
ncbi:MAG: nucleoside hydrolase [Lachnospiraceae bacterium]